MIRIASPERISITGPVKLSITQADGKVIELGQATQVEITIPAPRQADDAPPDASPTADPKR